ncbi:ATP-grasp domain-containing protein [Hyphococcus sp.]|uniref:carboxylate--amine ligase n=1 Tax=Hyphococcus sp. TaxID=2038636 RepID=UPI003CCC05D6
MDRNTGNAAIGRVIVTYGRSLMSLSIARSLHERGVEIIGCDDVGMTALSFSKSVSEYFIHPVRDDEPEEFIRVMIEKAKEFRPDDDRPYILMPAFEGMRFFAEHRARFEGVIDIAAPDFDAINRVDPKDHLVDTAAEFGLHTPQTKPAHSLDELKSIAENVNYPVMLKANDQVGGRGVEKAKDAETLIKLYEARSEKEALVQEFIEGEDYCHTVLFERGELKGSMAYKNLRQWPRPSGAGVLRETVADAPFVEATSKLLAPLKWNGIAEIDYRWSGSENDPAYLIEVNPRFWAGLYHSMAAGVDFPWLLYELSATGSVVSSYEAKIGESTRIPGAAMLSAISEIAESELDFGKVKDAWKHAGRSLKEGRIGEAFRIFSRNIGKVVDRDDAAFHLMEAFDQAKHAKGEISLKEDAASNLGFLYVVSSLLRHGELPPEMKH